MERGRLPRRQSQRVPLVGGVRTVQPLVFAAGYGEQYLWVCPALDLITVFTAEYRLPPAQVKDDLYLVTDYILPAVME